MSLITQISEAYEREHQNLAPARSAEDIPSSYELITPEWLTDVLTGANLQAQVQSFRLDVRDDGSYNRRRIFIEWNDAGRNTDLPKSVFCKASHSLENRLMFGNSGSIRSEVNFYRDVRPTLEIEAPRALYANYDPISFNSMLMLEDLGPDVHFCRHTTEMTRERVEGQLRTLAYLHGRFYENERLKETAPLFLTFHEKMRRLSEFKFEEICYNGFVAAESVIPLRLFKRIDEVWPATIRAVEHGHKLPPTLNHADVHLANWYILPNGGIGLTDWSATCVYHWARDVCYMISTSLSVENRRAWERELLTYYLDQLRGSGGPAVQFSDAWNWYREQLSPALAYWTSTLAPASDMPDFQPENLTLEFIKRLAAAMDDLGTLDC